MRLVLTSLKLSISKQTFLTKVLEIIFLFIATPLVLWATIPILIKVIYLVLVTTYTIWVGVTKEKIRFKRVKTKIYKKVFSIIGFRILLITSVTAFFIYFYDRDAFFNVILSKPLLWFQFSMVYIIASVIPQELIYREFFMKRYAELFKNRYVFMIANALLFSFAHIWFRSWIVLGFTFAGGIMFFLTYRRSKSLFVVILEHSIYGIWLYTVGYGEMFKFPV